MRTLSSLFTNVLHPLKTLFITPNGLSPGALILLIILFLFCSPPLSFPALVPLFIVMKNFAYQRHKRFPCNLFFHQLDRKSTRLNSSHSSISYAVFCLKK